MNKTTDEIRQELLSHNDEYARIVEELNYFGTKIKQTELEEFALEHIDLPEHTVKAIYEELRALPMSTGHGVPRSEKDIRDEQLRKGNKLFLVQILQETSDKHGIRMERIEQIVQDNARAMCIVDEALQNGLLENAKVGIILIGNELPNTPHYHITTQGARWLMENRQ